MPKEYIIIHTGLTQGITVAQAAPGTEKGRRMLNQSAEIWGPLRRLIVRSREVLKLEDCLNYQIT